MQLRMLWKRFREHWDAIAGINPVLITPVRLQLYKRSGAIIFGYPKYSSVYFALQKVIIYESSHHTYDLRKAWQTPGVDNQRRTDVRRMILWGVRAPYINYAIGETSERGVY